MTLVDNYANSCQPSTLNDKTKNQYVYNLSKMYLFKTIMPTHE